MPGDGCPTEQRMILQEPAENKNIHTVHTHIYLYFYIYIYIYSIYIEFHTLHICMSNQSWQRCSIKLFLLWSAEAIISYLNLYVLSDKRPQLKCISIHVSNMHPDLVMSNRRSVPFGCNACRGVASILASQFTPMSSIHVNSTYYTQQLHHAQNKLLQKLFFVL